VWRAFAWTLLGLMLLATPSWAAEPSSARSAFNTKASTIKGAMMDSAAKPAPKTKKKKSASLVKQVTSAPKRLATSTKKLFTPKKKPEKKQASVTSVRRSQDREQGFFKRWFNNGPSGPPDTIEEWMALEPIRP